MKKKSALNLDSRYKAMIENAFYYSNPPASLTIAREVRPPKHEFVRKLLYKDLNKVTTEKVCSFRWPFYTPLVILRLYRRHSVLRPRQLNFLPF